jgi:hypothetical protein
MNNAPLYWFPAKRYGIGWGLPSTWQGWAATGMAVVLLCAGVKLFPTHSPAVWVALYYFLVAVGWFAICLAKGEPLRWRWRGAKGGV